MKIIALILVLVVAATNITVADDLYDYYLALEKQFTQKVEDKVVIITAQPKLFEQEFTLLVQKAKSNDAKPQTVRDYWKANYKSMTSNGYIFIVSFELINQNLDSNSTVTFKQGLWTNIYLVNSAGEKAIMYKFTGDRHTELDFSTPIRKMECYFNTTTVKGKPLLRKGIRKLKLVVDKYKKNSTPLELNWRMPLSYKNIPRPDILVNYYGKKPLRTIIPYRVKVNKAPKLTNATNKKLVIPTIKRKKQTSSDNKKTKTN